MGVWDGIAVETITYIVSRATEGAHAPSCPGASRVARPHKLIHLKRALRRPRPSSLAAIDIYFFRSFGSARLHANARPWREARALARLSQPAGAHGEEGRRERKNGMWCRIVACVSLSDVW